MARSSGRGPRWRAFRQRVFRERGRFCERCGFPGRLEIHHRVEVDAGGALYDLGNVEVLCRSCHIAHHHPDSQSPERLDWLRFVEF